MKQINVENLQFSKVVCGTNPFYSKSHFSLAKDIEYRNRFDKNTIKEMLKNCMYLGINAIETSANEMIWDIVSELRSKMKKTLHFIGTTRIDDTSDMKSHYQKLEYLVKNRAEICIIHSQYIDEQLEGDMIKGLDKMVNEIHEAGLIAGISTHRIAVVELCEKKNLGVDVYMFPLNLAGFVYPGYDGKETAKERSKLIKSINKSFIIIKALGAGRIPPDEGLHFIAENIKANDIISIGFGNKEEINESIRISKKYFEAS